MEDSALLAGFRNSLRLSRYLRRNAWLRRHHLVGMAPETGRTAVMTAESRSLCRSRTHHWIMMHMIMTTVHCHRNKDAHLHHQKYKNHNTDCEYCE